MSDAEHPTLRVVRGTPDDAELAAVVAVLAVSAGHRDGTRTAPAAPAGTGGTRGGWADPADTVRSPPPPGRGAWVASGREPGVRTRAAL